MEKACSNCAYLIKKDGEASCQVTNPGSKTIVEQEEHVCPKWERKNLKSLTKSPKKVKEDFITYEIMK